MFDIPQNLIDYVKVYKNHLPIDLCKSAIKNLKNINWEEHKFYNSKTKEYVQFDNEFLMSWNDIPEKEEISNQIWFALNNYICKDFNNFNSWFDGWHGYTGVRFNKYDINTKMKLHCDHIQLPDNKGIPSISVLGLLNDEYEGGEFIICGNHKIELPTGSVVVFPSNFMFPHEVKPVKSGIRYSYISWAW
jgi:hypothetical protein